CRSPAQAPRGERSQAVAPQIVISRPTETLTTPTPLLIQNAWDDSPSPQFQTPSRLGAPSAMNGSPATARTFPGWSMSLIPARAMVRSPSFVWTNSSEGVDRLIRTWCWRSPSCIVAVVPQPASTSNAIAARAISVQVHQADADAEHVVVVDLVAEAEVEVRLGVGADDRHEQLLLDQVLEREEVLRVRRLIVLAGGVQ